MRILAVDTTAESGGVAIWADGQLVSEVNASAPDGFAHILFQLVEEALQQASVKLERIDCFAAASGPGSFTGVRVGLSAVKGMAAALGKPAIGVSNLKALALFGNLPLRATILDARRGEVYVAVYDANLEPVVPEAVLPLSTWLENLEAAEYEFIAHANAPFRNVLASTRFAEMPWTEAPASLAPAVAQAAALSKPQDPGLLDANYVRRSDAEMSWRDAG